VFTQSSLGEDVDLPLDTDHVLVELQYLSDYEPRSAVEHAAQVQGDRLEAISDPAALGVDVGNENRGAARLLVVFEYPHRTAASPISHQHGRSERTRSTRLRRAHNRTPPATRGDLVELRCVGRRMRLQLNP